MPTTLEFLAQFVNGRFLELRAIHPNDPRSRPNEFFGENNFDRIPEFLHVNANHHLFFGVAERGTPNNGGGLNNCSSCAALFADLDFKMVPEEESRSRLSIFPLQPSIQVHTGGGLHCYFLLNPRFDFTTPEATAHFKRYLQRLAFALHADPACADPARVLRVPNTTNWKYPAEVTIEYFNDERHFDISEFDFLPEAPQQAQERDRKPDAAPTSDQDRLRVMRRFSDYLSNGDEDPIEHVNRDQTTYRLASVGVKDFGLSEEDVFTVMWPWNEFRCKPPWSEEGLRTKIRNGAKYGTHPVGELRDKPLDPLQPCEEQDDQEPPASDPSEEEEKPRSKPAATLKNAVRAILSNPELSKIIYYDDFLRRPMTGDPPREWTDTDDIELAIRLQSLRGFAKIGLETTRNAAIAVAFRNRKNCVKDWLESLHWDEVPRIDHFFEDHFGADATAYTRAASKNFWLSMIARVYRPGCQVDHMPVLEGAQGIGKSAALRIIGGEYFAEQTETPTGKDFFQVLQAKLLMEISEMDSFNRAEVTRVKQVITCTSDRFRESYGRHAKDHPRQCVFVGTTNKDDWNRDETGARRFWPIACKGEIDLDGIRTNRDQLFAEAVRRFKNSESWWPMPLEETQAEQEERYAEDPWTELIAEFIRPRSSTTVLEILTDCLKFDVAQITKSDQMRVSACLRRLDWTKGKRVRDPQNWRNRSVFWIPKDA